MSKTTPAAFDWDTPKRGAWATLSSGPFQVMLTEYPGSLLAMLRAGVLGGEAKRDAEEMDALDAWNGETAFPSVSVSRAVATELRRSPS